MQEGAEKDLLRSSTFQEDLLAAVAALLWA